jgi:dUTP pyrophosphatase
MKILYKKLDPKARVPSYSTQGAAGADIYALLTEPLTVRPHCTVTVKSGVAVQIPEGYVGLIFARSGLASKRGLAPANKVGVIDWDYRGELMVSLHNHGEAAVSIEPYERVAQLVIVPYMTCDFEETDALDDTHRGTGGFGSTGRI